jgi:hypothetical protein
MPSIVRIVLRDTGAAVEVAQRLRREQVARIGAAWALSPLNGATPIRPNVCLVGRAGPCPGCIGPASVRTRRRRQAREAAAATRAGQTYVGECAPEQRADAASAAKAGATAGGEATPEQRREQGAKK